MTTPGEPQGFSNYAFGELLRQYRIAAGLTQEGLAERTGLGVRSIQHLEGGSHRPHRETTARLVSALGLSGEERTCFERAAQRPLRQRPASSDPPANLPGDRASQPAACNGLAGQLTSFIGRERELTEIKHLLAQTRLLTLVGSGGCGKTRLALQVAAESLGDYPDGVGVVELASLSDPALVPHVVATNLEVREEPNQSILTTLVRALQAQRVLVVLDNCEHLIEACARLADTLLRHCPTLQILATSREVLGIGGEVSWRVPSMAVPPPEPLPPFESFLQYEGIRLFADRASAALTSFRITPQNASAVAQVCYRLDGIPLAIELAAARVRALTAEQIATHLNDRFRLLTGGSRIDLPRHQTLRALVDWSYVLLGEAERRLLNQLSVFAGGWTLEAAEAVCKGDGIDARDVLSLLAHLVDRSMVLAEAGVEPSESAVPGVRYRLLETLQHYAAEKLKLSGEESRAWRRHLEWCVALAEQAGDQEDGHFGTGQSARLEAELDNLRVALERSILLAEQFEETDRNEGDLGLRLAGALWPLWERRGYWSEGRRWLERLLSVPCSRTSPARARVLHGAATFADARGDRGRAVALLEEALATHRDSGDILGVAFTTDRLGQMAFRQGDHPRAIELAEESLVMYRRIGDPVLVADALDTLGQMVYHQGDLGRATALLEESLRQFRKLGDKRGIAAALRSLLRLASDRGEDERVAELAEESVAHFREIGDNFDLGLVILDWARAVARRGDHQRAEELLQEGLRDHRAVGDKYSTAVKLGALAMVVQEQREFARAAPIWKESLALHRELGDESGIAECLAGLAEIANAIGHPGPAARWLGASETLRAQRGPAMHAADPSVVGRTVADIRAGLGEHAFRDAWTGGRALPLAQAIAEAMALEVPPPVDRTPARVEPTATVPRDSVLTRREIDVLRLIALGRTNNEIAAELVISVPTVERHVTHIYEKIGARGRADATSYALRHGFV